MTDTSVNPTGSPNIVGPRLDIPPMGEKPVHNRPAWFIAGVALFQFALFVALLGPVVVSMQLKINTLVGDPATQAAMIGRVLPPGALAAVIGNALFGRLSDRTTSRFGRRRPWMIGGAMVLAAALLFVALGTAEWMLTLGWFITQLAANAAFSAFFASLADQLSDHQYARTSAMVGIMQNLGIMVATWMGALFESNMLLLFLVPGLMGLVGMIVYALMLPEPVLVKNRYPFNVKELVQTFWTSPFKHPDFGLAWWCRFLIILASYLFITFRLQYMTQHLGLDQASATTAIGLGVTIYTVVSMGASYLAGWISDRTGKRKLPVMASSVLFGIGTYLLVHAESVAFFYFCEAVMGLAYGAYIAVDLALVLEVLPDPETRGKDLGVINMANALPQSLAPALGAWMLAGLGGGTNFMPLLATAGVVALIGGLVVIPIKGVK